MEWISTKKMLPGSNGKYLILVQKRPMISIFYEGYFYRSRAPKRYYKNWLTENKRYRCVVTHWMMLPSYPTENNDV